MIPSDCTIPSRNTYVVHIGVIESVRVNGAELKQQMIAGRDDGGAGVVLGCTGKNAWMRSFRLLSCDTLARASIILSLASANILVSSAALAIDVSVCFMI